MANITVFGKGNMGSAIGGLFEKSGHKVSYLGSGEQAETIGDMLILAVPYPAVADILDRYAADLDGKVVVDITNPVNFDTFDDLLVPADSSATAAFSKKVPTARWVKGFNTTFAATLASGQVSGREKNRVMLASDDAEAKAFLTDMLVDSGITVLDAGGLKRARELEAFGFLQISLAAQEKISWTGGFAILD